MLIIEVLKGHHEVTMKTVGKDDKKRTLYEQKVFRHELGEPFPEKSFITHKEPAAALPVGKYVIDGSSFKRNQFGSIELDKYDVKFLPLSDALEFANGHLR